MTDPVITAVVFEPAFSQWAHAAVPCAVGVVIDGSRIVWGSVAPPGETGFDAETAAQLAAQISADLISAPLEGADLLTLLQRLTLTTVDGLSAGLTALHLAVEQALTGAVAMANRLAPGDVLNTIVPPGEGDRPLTPRLILEVDNRVATAEMIQQMLAVAPDGVGYRVAGGGVVASIGPRGEYLQRFVRELGILLQGYDSAAAGPPIIYLGSEGALGALTADPWRDLGQILGDCYGLEQAAGAVELWLEDPIALEDEVRHAATLNRLRADMRTRTMRSQVIGRARTATLDGLRLLSDTDAVDGFCLRRSEWPALAPLVEATQMLRAAGKQVVLATDPHATPDQVAHTLSLARSIGAAAVLVNISAGGDYLVAEAAGQHARHRAWGTARQSPAPKSTPSL
jgi:hypothetical protein